jgi:uncharacterized protein YukE
MWKKSTGLIRFDDPIMRSMATDLRSKARDLGGLLREMQKQKSPLKVG